MIYIHNDSQEALGSHDSIPLRGGNPIIDHTGPIISFETTDQRIIRSGDHISKN